MSRASKKLVQANRVISSLLAGRTDEQAASDVGMEVSALKRLLNEDGFRKLYRDARHRVVDHAIARLQAMCGNAVDTLQTGLSSEKPSDQIRASLTIFDLVFKGVSLLEMEERLTRIEEELQKSSR